MKSTKKTNAIRLLEQKKIAFDCLEYTYHSDDLSVEKIALDNHLELQQIYKTLVVQGDKTGIIVALIGGHQSLSLKKLATTTGNKKVALLAVKDLQKYTGYIRGGCSPIGMKKQYPTYLSTEAQQLEKIYVNAGVRGVLVGLDPLMLQKTTHAVWATISQD